VTGYGTVKVTADGIRWLVNQHFAEDPDTIAVSPLAAEDLRLDLSHRGQFSPADAIEGCTVVIDEGLSAGGWELRRGSDVIATGFAK